MNVRNKLQISWNYECCEKLQINTVDIIIKSMIYFYDVYLLNMTSTCRTGKVGSISE